MNPAILEPTGRRVSIMICRGLSPWAKDCIFHSEMNSETDWRNDMRKYLFLFIVLAVAIVGCSNDPSAPSGNLPNVTNLTVDETASKGDSVVLVWDPLDQDVDGYHIYYATTVPGDWGEPGLTADTTWTHIATSTGYYEVKASKGLEYSAGFSNRVNCRAEENYFAEMQLRANSAANGLLFDADGLGWATGIADSSEFTQDLYVDVVDNKIYLFSGDHNPALYPGGHSTKLCDQSGYGNVAPEAGSADWADSIQVTGPNWIFIQLENGDYAEFYVDSVYTDGVDLPNFEYQTINGLRLFNVL